MGYTSIVGNDPSVCIAVDSAGRLGVNQALIGGNAVAVGSGVAGTGVQRVILATDQTSVPSVGPGAAGTTLAAATGNVNGTTVDFGGACSVCTLVAVGTATLAGTLTIEGSVDGTTFVSTGTTVALTAAATVTATSTAKAFRYYRVSLSGAGGAGTVTAKILAGQ